MKVFEDAATGPRGSKDPPEGVGNCEGPRGLKGPLEPDKISDGENTDRTIGA